MLQDGKFTVKKKLTVPISPKTHFKERNKDIVKEELLNKTNIRDRSFNKRVLQAPAALGKFTSKSVNKKSFFGGQTNNIDQVN